MVGVASLLREREEDLRVIRERVSDLSDGVGCVVLVEGRAGAGKTALLDAGIAVGRNACREVRVARVRESERGVPGATLRRLGLNGASDTAWREIASLADADAGPAVVAVDDLHLADAESVAALTEVADRIEDFPLLLMLALRPGEWSAGDPVVDRLREAARVEALRPAALSPYGVARVFEDCGGIVLSKEAIEAQTAWTAGIPLFVTKVAGGRVEAGTVPDPVAVAVRGELRRLPSAQAALTRALSVFGSGTPLRQAARLAGLDRSSAERAADGLARRGLIEPGDPLRFRAPIEGAAFAASIEPFERARAHKRAAAVLSDEAVDVVAVADHLVLTFPAGEPEVVATLRAAADRAVAEGHPERAARYLERALDEPPAGRERDDTVRDLVNVEVLSGRPASLDRVERIVGRLDDGGLPAVHALRELGTLQFLRNEPARATATLARALEHAGDDEGLRQALLGDYLAAASFAPKLDAAAGARFVELMTAIAAGEPLPADPGLLVQVAQAMANGGAPRAVVLEIIDGLLAAVPTLDGPPFGLFAAWVAAACVYVDELDLAEQVSRRFHEAAVEAGDVVRQGRISYWLGMALFHAGQIDDAIAPLEAALLADGALWKLTAPWPAAALCIAHLERRQPDEATRVLALIEDVVDPDALHMSILLEARGHVAMAAGDFAVAREHYEASGRHLAERFRIEAPTLITWRSNAAFAICADGGDLRRAHALAEHELALARATGAPRQQARALRAAAAALPKSPKAIRLLREALAITTAAGPRLEHMHALADLGAAFIAAGKPMQARQPLYDALELSETCGAAAVAARTRSLLRTAGARPRRAMRSGRGALTSGEHEVATLAAAGHSNRSIADALSLSERTVESHLYNTFKKLGIHRREQLPPHLPADVGPSTEDSRSGGPAVRGRRVEGQAAHGARGDSRI